MKATIKILSNYEEIQRAEKLSLAKTPEPEYKRGTLYFHVDAVHHFYVDTVGTDGQKDLVIYLVPNNCFRVEYDDYVHDALAERFGF